MKHCGTRTLETGRLVLRRFCINDAQAMFDNWAGDCEVTKYLTWPTHENVETSRAILADWVSGYEKDDRYQWAITLKENGDAPIGSIGVVKKNDDIQMVHIGYCIGQSWWNRGIMSEALSALIKFFFEEVGAIRIELYHDTRNAASGKVMQKCGLIYEGTFRQAERNNQGICNAAMYAILAEEYFASCNSRRDNRGRKYGDSICSEK